MSREIRANELLALKEIAEMLNSTNERDTMLNDVLVKLLQVSGFTAGWIFIMDDCAGNLCVAAQNLPPALSADNNELMCGKDCSCIESYQHNKLEHAVNIMECKRIANAVKHKLGDTEGITHHATVPLNAGKDRFGLLNVATQGKGHFSEDEMALLQAVAIQIGTALKRIRLYQAQEQNAILYAKLGDVIQRINSIQDINQLPLKAVRIIGDTFEWPHVSLFMYEQHELSLRAHYTDKRLDGKWQSLDIDQAGPVRTAYRDNRIIIDTYHGVDSCASLTSIGIPPYGSAAAIPLRIRSHPIGVLFISSPSNIQFEHYHEDFMYSLGDHFTLCVENLRIYEQRSELALMEERNRVARDLHDSVIQKIFSLSFLAKGAETVLAGNEPVVQRSLQEISHISQEVLKEMRSLIWQLHPAGLENGLLPALKHYGQAMDLTIYELAEGVKDLPRAIEEAFWRIGQEALNNVKKHSGTNVAHIRLVKSDTGASLEIIDRGNGFATDKISGKLTMGLTSMRERAEALGGELSISSGNGNSTVIKVTIPIAVIVEKCSEEKEQQP
ncbi:GAF domain-containing sensor histidine kinase [Cohnella silvisoli]|uniref:histidine kinase n=1 Tax=Cohnella silvisoli TaxID=2873699 RepID=A0ABV1L0R2_9BACL|nr:GAF domain-containing sensor histidine kinase [Cohnella silvisoli]MCD9025387.1 GAF domain-containing sensor histidine kinase [Cohnella silvisoli]